MVKIGAVTLDTSHPMGFAEELEKYCMDMKYEYVYDNGFRDRSEGNWFAKRYCRAGRVERIEDMADKVDIGFIHACNWDKHLDEAEPFIKCGTPVMIDKPIVGSVKDIKRLRKLVRDGAKILGASSARYADEVQEFLKRPIEERGKIVSIFGTCGVDEFNYGIHIVEIFSELAGAKGINCRFDGCSEDIDGHKCEMYSVKFENGVCGTYYITSGRWHPFDITVMTTAGTYHFKIDSSKIYVALMREIYRELTYKKSNLADVETLINCTEIMLCGKKSRDEKNGAVVAVSELGDSDSFDGYAFEKEYGGKATLMYKD